jgi:glutamate-1-semialdehyde 2,1-aminomutase
MIRSSIRSLESLIDEYVAKNSGSQRLYARAKQVEPGGNSRTGAYFSPFPLFAARGEGVTMTDVDGNRRLDFVNNNTSLMLGNAHPAVVQALAEQAQKGTAFACPTEIELELAAMLQERVPSVETLRFCNSGTEAVLNALRAARAFTGRHKIAKCEGAYHGVEDHMLVSLNAPQGPWSGPDHRPQPVACSAGLTPAVLEETVVIPFNDSENTRRILEEHGDELAAVIVDPMLTSACVTPAEEAYIRMLRVMTTELGILLIFDEIITFRVARGGMQELLGINPDLTTLAKVAIGGLPGGAWGGRADVMALYDPSVGTPLLPQSGTFNGNPLSMAAGIATLQQLTPNAYAKMDRLGERLRSKLTQLFQELDAPAVVTGLGSLFRIHFTDGPVRTYRDTLNRNIESHRKLFFWLLNHGLYIDVRGMGCLSLPMEDAHIDCLVDGVASALVETGIARTSA